MKLFSIEKNNFFTKIRILGFKLKIPRRAYRNLRVILKNQQVVLEKLQRRKEKKYRIGFLIGEIQKWKCQSVYDLMKRQLQLQPIIVITPLIRRGEDLIIIEERIREIRDYCVTNNMDYVVSWDYSHKKTLSFDSFQLDLIFYQQPWNINKEHTILHTSEQSLAYYVPYYVPNYGNLEYDCKSFHFQLFRYYVLNQSWKNLYLSKMKNCDQMLQAVGHPTLDYYLTHKPRSFKQYVIYAPHHSFASGSIGYGTFPWSGLEILNFAKKHPELEWVYKPHPLTKRMLISNGIMNSKEVDEYWSSWKKIGSVYEGADYLPLFNDSCCLITDCGSFLVEYFYTGKPVIHLISEQAPKPYSALTEIINCYYAVTEKKQLINTLNEILINKKDPLLSKRQKKIKLDLQNKQSCAERIVNDIKRTLHIQ